MGNFIFYYLDNVGLLTWELRDNLVLLVSQVLDAQMK